MKYTQLPGSRKSVSRIVYGGDRLAQQDAAHLDLAYERGITAFDTARLYEGSEAVLGSWMTSRGLRDSVYIITKCAYPGAGRRHRLTLQDVMDDLQRSLDALRSDYVDLLMFHYDVAEIAAEEVAAIVRALHETGRVRAVGAANTTVPRWRAIDEACARLETPGLAALSVQLSLPVLRTPMWPWPGSVSIGGEEGRASREWLAERRVPLLAYSCLGRGFFREAFWLEGASSTPARAPFRGQHGDVSWLRSRLHTPENIERYRRAMQLAATRGATPAQIGLAYLFCQKLELCALLGWSSMEQCEELVRALAIELDPDEVTWLEARDLDQANCAVPGAM